MREPPIPPGRFLGPAPGLPSAHRGKKTPARIKPVAGNMLRNLGVRGVDSASQMTQRGLLTVVDVESMGKAIAHRGKRGKKRRK